MHGPRRSGGARSAVISSSPTSRPRGTVLFAGYGSTLRDPTELGRASLRRSEDGFFLKLSYLFQM